MVFEANVDATRTLAFLKNGERHVSYSIANALNRTLKDCQAAVRAKAAGVLTLRSKREFILRMIGIPKYASVKANRYEARLSIGNRKKGLLLTMLETGGEHVPVHGASVAIPAIGGARMVKAADVDPELFIKLLRIKQVGRTRRGLLGTFIIEGLGILQRRDGKTRLVYALKPEVKVPPKLQFEATAMKVAVERFPIHLNEQVKDAMEHEFTKTLEEAFR